MFTFYSPDKLSSTAVVLIVDLSKPERMWSTVTSLVSSITEYIASALKTEQAKNLKVEERLEKEALGRVGEDHPDIQHVKPFPVPLLILGGMYDVFQDLEPEKKKVICRTLRYLAHMNGASVQFYSSRDPGLVKKARDLLSHHGFNTPPGKGVSQDYNKPLIIPAGSDSFQAILGGNGSEVPKLEVMRHQFGTHFPQEEEETLTRSEDPAKDPNFREAEVDMLRLQKDEDLERYRRESERRQRSWGDIDMDASMI